jgi:8-oxo-dGTP diphosphatase
MPPPVLEQVSCADAIAFYESTGKIVVVERLGSVKGLALPGGKREKKKGEYLSRTILREVLEESGLTFTITDVMDVYADPDRDPRGRYVSVVFIGTATGEIRDEPGKTKVSLYDLSTFNETRHLFAFDHARILEDFLKMRDSNT